MERENKLVNKVKRLIKRVGLPRWLHRFGPKKYFFWQHAVALIIKQECRLGYRRVSKLLNWLGYRTPTYSALAKMAKRVHLTIWQRLLIATVSHKLNLVAIDGTGMSRPLPSPYYYKRIDKPYPVEIPLKLSIAVCTRTKKILALRLRAKSAHDLKDVKYLIKRLPSKPKKIIADKGYDAEWLHKFCLENGIQTCIPIRNFGHAIHKMWSLRRKQAKQIKQKTYGRREIVESVIGAIKRKFGTSVNSISTHSRRVEMYCRAIAHNIMSNLEVLFQRSHSVHNIYII